MALLNSPYQNLLLGLASLRNPQLLNMVANQQQQDLENQRQRQIDAFNKRVNDAKLAQLEREGKQAERVSLLQDDILANYGEPRSAPITSQARGDAYMPGNIQPTGGIHDLLSLAIAKGDIGSASNILNTSRGESSSEIAAERLRLAQERLDFLRDREGRLSAERSAREDRLRDQNEARQAADFDRRAKPFKEAISGSERAIEQIDSALKLLDEDPGVAGLMGSYRRIKGGAEGYFTGQADVNAEKFYSNLQSIISLMRVPFVGPGNPAQAEWKRLMSMLKGLGALDSAPVAKTSLSEIRSQLEKIANMNEEGLRGLSGYKEDPQASRIDKWLGGEGE